MTRCLYYAKVANRNRKEVVPTSPTGRQGEAAHGKIKPAEAHRKLLGVIFMSGMTFKLPKYSCGQRYKQPYHSGDTAYKNSVIRKGETYGIFKRYFRRRTLYPDRR